MKKIILVDSVDKRMTVPLVRFLLQKRYDVHGLHFEGTKVLCSGVKVVHTVHKETMVKDLTRIYSNYNKDAILLIGNPFIISATNAIKPHLKYLVPTDESIEMAEDKAHLMVIARPLKLKVPEESKTDFPLIVKLNNSERSSLTAQKRYRIVHNKKELADAVKNFDCPDCELNFQKLVSGSGYGVSMILDETSNLVDYIVHERELEYPIVGGPSAICRTVDKPELVQEALALLQSLKWKGLAMVEFKGDTLLEINPRFWGSMPLIFKAKSPFFEHYLKLVDGLRSLNSDREVQYNVGVRMYYLPQALMSIGQLIRKFRFISAVKNFGRLFTGKEAIFNLMDPMPFFKYISTLIGRR